MSASLDVPLPSFGQRICANRKCFTVFIIVYLGMAGVFYVSFTKDIFWLTVISCVVLLISILIAVRYRDKNTYKCILWIALLLVIICDFCVIYNHLNTDRDNASFLIGVISYSLGFLLSIYGIYHAKIIIANFQPIFRMHSETKSTSIPKSIKILCPVSFETSNTVLLDSI